MLSTEQLEIRELAREFASGEIRGGSMEWDAARELPGTLKTKLAELGFFGMRIPEGHGGLGLDLTTFLVALEELAWGDAAAALPVAIHNGAVAALLIAAGSGDQQTWLARLASGEAVGSWAVSEDGAEDVDGIETTATRDGDDWILSGRKARVIRGIDPALLVVAARTGPAADDLGLFLVEGDAPGLVEGSRANTLGLRALHMVDLTFQDLRLPGEALVGPATGGRALLDRVASESRLGVAAIALGIARSAAEHAVSYALERSQFGQAIAGFEAVQEKLGGMATRIATARAMVHLAAARVEGGSGAEPASLFEAGQPQAAAAMARLVAGETAEWVASEAVQIFGGYGYMRDYPVEKLMRDAQATQILEGTVEMLRLVVARAVLQEARGDL